MGEQQLTGESVPCKFCLAAWGEGFDCSRHTSTVQELAERLAEHFQGVEPSDEQIGWFMEDAEAIAGEWADGTPLDVRFLGHQADERQHFTVNGQRWAEADPTAEGFNVCEPMDPCPFPHDDDACEECKGSGWVTVWVAEACASGGSE